MSLALVQRAEDMAQYFRLRDERPEVPAVHVFQYLQDDQGLTLDQFLCGHEWMIDEETDRCYCCQCGMDGDA